MDSNIDDSDATNYHVTEDPTDLYEEEIISSLDTSLDTDSNDNQSVNISILNDDQINDDDSDYKIDDTNDIDDDNISENLKPITDHQYIRSASMNRHRKRRKMQIEINDDNDANRIDVDEFYGFVNISDNDYVKRLTLLDNYLKCKEKLDAIKSLNISNDCSVNNESSSSLINENVVGEYAMTIADVAKFGRRSLTKQLSSTSSTSTATTPTRTPRKSKIDTTPTKSDTPKTYAGRRLKYSTSESLTNPAATEIISPSISAASSETGQEQVEPLTTVQDKRPDNNSLINEILEKLKLSENVVKQMVDICFQELKTIEEYSTIFVQPKNQLPLPSSDNTRPAITHEIIENKVITGSYESIESYHSDIKTMIDNYILTTECTNRIKKDLKQILNQCKQDDYDLNACKECFLNSKRSKMTENFFIKVCRRPHLLVWAKLKGYPYWPAKVISINKTNSIDIRFFGGHQRATISPKDCYLFTENDPKLNVSTTRTLNSNPIAATSNDTKDKSLAEINEHIKVIKNVIGKFVYAKEITKLSPKRFNQYISMMFPTYNKINENNETNKTSSFENELKLTIIKTPDNNLTVKNYRQNVNVQQQQPTIIDNDNDNMYEVVTQSNYNDNEKCVESLIIKRKLPPISSKSTLSSVIPKSSTSTSSKDDKIIEKQKHDKEIFENAVKSLPSSIVITPVTVSSTTAPPKPPSPPPPPSLPPTSPIDGKCTITLTRHTTKQQLVQTTTKQSQEEPQEKHQDSIAEKIQEDNSHRNLIQAEHHEKLDQEIKQQDKQNSEKKCEEKQEDATQQQKQIDDKKHQQEKRDEQLCQEIKHQEKQQKRIVDKQKPEKQQQNIEIQQNEKEQENENQTKLHQQNKAKQQQEKPNLENEQERQGIENQPKKVHHEKLQRVKRKQGKQQQKQQQRIIIIKQKQGKHIQEPQNKEHKEKQLQHQEIINFEKQEQKQRNEEQQENLKEQQQILMDSFQSTDPGPSSTSLGPSSASLLPLSPTINSLELSTKSNQIKTYNKNRVRVRDIRTLITKPPILPPPLTYHSRSILRTSTITSGQYERSLLDNHGGSIEWPRTNTTNTSVNVSTTNINEPSSLINNMDEMMPLSISSANELLLNRNNQATRITTTISDASSSSLMNDIEKLIPIDCTALSLAAGGQSTGLFSNINEKINDILISHIQQRLNEKLNTSTITHRNDDNQNSLSDINTKATIQQLTDKMKHIKLANKETLTKFQNDLNKELIELQRQHEIEMGHLKNMEIQRNNVERQQIINELKLKQWCNNCRKEAFYHCCWNTEYCDEKCQNDHWPKHVQSCTRILVENRSAINYVRIVDPISTTTGMDTTSNEIKLTPVIGSMVIPPPQLRKHNFPSRQLAQLKRPTSYNLNKQPNVLPEYNLHQQHQQICVQLPQICVQLPHPHAYSEYNDQLQHVLATQSTYQWHHQQQQQQPQKQGSVRKRQQNKTEKKL